MSRVDRNDFANDTSVMLASNLFFSSNFCSAWIKAKVARLSVSVGEWYEL